MIESAFLRDLGVILVAAAAFALAARPLRVPGVVAYIFAGLALGPATGLVEVTEQVEMLSELGVALLLFLVGLEMSVQRVREVGSVAVTVGVAQLVLTFGAAWGLSLALGFSPDVAVVVALAMTFSSTAVVVKLLGQRRELAERHGRIAVGILLVQDVAVVLALTLVGALGSAGGAELSGLGLPLGALAALTAAALVAARWVLPSVFRQAAGARETVLVWSLTWCMLFVLASESVHLPLEIGAFVAGIALAQLPQAHDLSRRVAPLTNFFLAVFFVSLGIRIDPLAAVSRPGDVAVLALFVLLGKTMLFLALFSWRGEDERTAFRASVALGQVSEFSFVLVALAVTAGLVEAETFSVVGTVGLLTIALSSFAVVRSGALHRIARNRGLLRPFRAAPPSVADAPEAHPLVNHVIVVGMNALGRTLVSRLSELGEDVVAVDRDPTKLAGLEAPTVVGDVEQPEVLEEAHLSTARLLVSALQIEDANKLLAHRCRRAGVAAAIHAFNPSVEEDLSSMEVDHLMDSKYEGARRFAERLRTLGVLGGG